MSEPLRYFTIPELCASLKATALRISNAPPKELLPALAVTMAGCERLRAFFGYPMLISSGYRCPELNAAVHGEPDSQHMRGEAVDFTCPAFGPPHELAKALASSVRILGIDQLILEPTWIHASFTLEPRYEVLTRMPGRGYAKGLLFS